MNSVPLFVYIKSGVPIKSKYLWMLLIDYFRSFFLYIKLSKFAEIIIYAQKILKLDCTNIGISVK